MVLPTSRLVVKSVVSRPRPLSLDALGSLVAKRMLKAGRPGVSDNIRIFMPTTASETSWVLLPVAVTSDASGALGSREVMFNRS